MQHCYCTSCSAAAVITDYFVAIVRLQCQNVKVTVTTGRELVVGYFDVDVVDLQHCLPKRMARYCNVAIAVVGLGTFRRPYCCFQPLFLQSQFDLGQLERQLQHYDVDIASAFQMNSTDGF